MPAARKEIVFPADPLDADDVPPCRGHDGLRRSNGRRIRRACLVRPQIRSFGFGQSATVDLAVRRQRQRVDEYIATGNHVSRQTRLGRLAQFRARAGPGGGAETRDDPRDQQRLTRCVRAQIDRRPIDGRVVDQRVLDFAELDAKSAQLHLLVHAAKALDVAFRQAASEITGAIHFLVRAERVARELLCRQCRAIPVTGADADAADA